MDEKIIPFAVLLLTVVAETARVSYRGVTLMEVKNVTDEDDAFFRGIVRAAGYLDHFVYGYRNRDDYILQIDKNISAQVEDYLKKKNLKRRTLVRDYQDLMLDERAGIIMKKRRFGLRDFEFGNHYSYEEITSYLWDLPTRSPLVKVDPVGWTREGRSILLVRISTMENSKPRRPIIFLDCTMHAREWASTTTCLWIINELSTKYPEDPNIEKLLEAYDWYIKPISNPDGYVYAWTTDRLWIKNLAAARKSKCFGVFLTQNFDTGSGEFGPRSRTKRCHSFYKGPYPFSEPETRATRDVLLELGDRVKMILFLGAYGQRWMSPYAENYTLPHNYEEMEGIMKIATEAIGADRGTKYVYGTVANLTYPHSDTALDYAFQHLGILHSYIIDLPDTGEWGFIVPVENIVPMAREVWSGIKAAAFALVQK